MSSRHVHLLDWDIHPSLGIDKVMMGKFINETSRDLDVLSNVVKVDIGNGIVRRMDVRVVVSKRRLKEKRRGESVAVGRGVIRASITTLRLFIWNIGVLFNQNLEEVVLTGIRVVSDETKPLHSITALVANHILVQHGLDLNSKARIGVEDVLRAKQASLLGRVPVKLDSIVMVALGNSGVLEESV